MAIASGHPDVDSFYHLDGVDVDASLCRGTACFAASHFNPRRWALASTRPARVHCLGKCYVAPAAGADRERPRVAVTSSRAVVLERIACGGARTLRDYQSMGGFIRTSSRRRNSPYLPWARCRNLPWVSSRSGCPNCSN